MPVLEVVNASRYRNETAPRPVPAEPFDRTRWRFFIGGSMNHQDRDVRCGQLVVEPRPKEHDAACFRLLSHANRERSSRVLSDQDRATRDVESTGTADVTNSGANIVKTPVIDGEPSE